MCVCTSECEPENKKKVQWVKTEAWCEKEPGPQRESRDRVSNMAKLKVSLGQRGKMCI